MTKKRQDSGYNAGEGKTEKLPRIGVDMELETLAKLRAIAYWDRTTIQAIATEAIERHIAYLEKKQGKHYEPIPEKAKLPRGRRPGR